jgi:hypothetical protein
MESLIDPIHAELRDWQREPFSGNWNLPAANANRRNLANALK